MSNVYPPHYAFPSSPPVQKILPQPPRLHWGWVLAINLVTIGFFGIVWMLVQAVWVKRYTGRSKAFWWALIYVLFIPAVFVVTIVLGVVFGAMHLAGFNDVLRSLQALIQIGSFVLYVATAFVIKGELEREPIGLSLSGVMTLLFAPIYLQYNIYDFDNPYGSGAGTLNLSQPTGLGLSGTVASLRSAPEHSPES